MCVVCCCCCCCLFGLVGFWFLSLGKFVFNHKLTLVVDRPSLALVRQCRKKKCAQSYVLWHSSKDFSCFKSIVEQPDKLSETPLLASSTPRFETKLVSLASDTVSLMALSLVRHQFGVTLAEHFGLRFGDHLSLAFGDHFGLIWYHIS